MVFEFCIPISNYRIYLVYSVLAFLWFSLYYYAWTIAVFTTNPSIETGQQSDFKKLQKISKIVKQCRMHPPAMPPNFKKNWSRLHEIRVFEVSMLCYAKTCLWRLAPFVASAYKYRFPRSIVDKNRKLFVIELSTKNSPIYFSLSHVVTDIQSVQQKSLYFKKLFLTSNVLKIFLKCCKSTLKGSYLWTIRPIFTKIIPQIYQGGCTTFAILILFYSSKSKIPASN